MNALPSRRAMLAAPATTTASTLASATAQSTVSPALTHLIAEADQLNAESDAYHVHVYQPAYERMMAAVAYAKATLSHTTLNTGPSIVGGNVDWSTRNPTAVALCKTLSRRTSAVANRDPAMFASARGLVAAHYRRERAIEQVRRGNGCDAECGESNRLTNAVMEAEERVAGFPAATIKDLHAKVAFMSSRCMGDGMDRTGTVLGDLERIILREGY